MVRSKYTNKQTNNWHSVQHNKKEICCLAIWLYMWLLNKSSDQAQAITFKPEKMLLENWWENERKRYGQMKGWNEFCKKISLILLLNRKTTFVSKHNFINEIQYTVHIWWGSLRSGLIDSWGLTFNITSWFLTRSFHIVCFVVFASKAAEKFSESPSSFPKNTRDVY